MKKNNRKTVVLKDRKKNNNKRKTFLIVLVIILIFLIAIATSALIVKYTYHRGFLKECYRVCYFNKSSSLWEYRPWGYKSEFVEENRDFPSIETCLSYCMSQKQIDFIKQGE
ncbi:MAG: hypothetical protein WC242_02795 [Candidatus Paceibacterota bacterium]|jgi:hypothetical protein